MPGRHGRSWGPSGGDDAAAGITAYPTTAPAAISLATNKPALPRAILNLQTSLRSPSVRPRPGGYRKSWGVSEDRFWA
jgi:hypothetical protein